MPRKRSEPWPFFLATIEKQPPVGVLNFHAQNFPVSIEVDLYTLDFQFYQNLAPKLETVCLPHIALSTLST